MLKLTPDMLAAAYDFLRLTAPFKSWRPKLPPSSELKFKVIKDPTVYADFGLVKDVPTIRVSVEGVGHTSTLLSTVAHEMIHLYQHLTGDKEVHGPRFKRKARSVCNAHGFDEKAFS